MEVTKPSNHLIRSLFIGVATAFVFAFAATQQLVYVTVLGRMFPGILIFPVWMGVFIFSHQFIRVDHVSYNGVFIITALSGCAGLIAYYFPSAHFFGTNLIITTSVVLGICIAWYNSAELKKREQLVIESQEKPTEKLFGRYKPIAFLWALYMLTMMFITIFNFESNFIKEDAYLSLFGFPLLFGSIFFFIFFMLDFSLVKAFFLTLTFAINYSLFMVLLGFLIPVVMQYYSAGYMIGYVSHPFEIDVFSVSVIMGLLTILTFQTGAFLNEFPQMATNDRFKRRKASMIRRQKRRTKHQLRKSKKQRLELEKTKLERAKIQQTQIRMNEATHARSYPSPMPKPEASTTIPPSKIAQRKGLDHEQTLIISQSAPEPNPHDSTPTSRSDESHIDNNEEYYAHYQHIATPQNDEISRNQASGKKKRRFRGIHPLPPIHLPSPYRAYKEDEGIGEAFSSWEYTLHAIMNGSWITGKLFTILLSLIYIWTTLFAVNSMNFQTTAGGYIPVGILLLCGLLLLFLSPDSGRLLDFQIAYKEKTAISIFLGITGLNLLTSIILPKFVLLLVLPELYFFVPFFTIFLQKYQENASKIETPVYNIVQCGKYILWIFISLNLLIGNRFIGLHFIILGIFLSIEILYYGFELGWQKAILPIILESTIIIGQMFLIWIQGFHLINGDFMPALSALISLPMIFMTGIFYHIIYLRVKKYAGDHFSPISEDLQHFLDVKQEQHQRKMEWKKRVEDLELNPQYEMQENPEESSQNEKNTAIQGQKSETQSEDYPKIEESQIDLLDSLYAEDEKVEMLCPICHMELTLSKEEIDILKSQSFIYCPSCREKVSVNEILEPSYNSLILEHRKIIENVSNNHNGHDIPSKEAKTSTPIKTRNP